MLTVRLQGQKKNVKKNITLIQIYAPTTNSDDEEAEDFYDAVQEAVDNTNKQDLIFILGDFNAKIGKETAPDEKSKAHTAWEQEMTGAKCSLIFVMKIRW